MRQNRQRLSDAFALPIPLEGTVQLVRESYEPGLVIPAHWHDVDQLIYAAAGVTTVETSDGVWVVPPARAVWVPAETEHRITMTGKVEMVSVYAESGQVELGLDRCCVVQVSAFLRELILRCAGSTSEDPDAVRRRREAVLLDEIRSVDVAPLELVMPTDDRARAVALEFLADPSQRLTRAEWAARVGASERTLERLFAQETNTTLGRWQAQARLLEALRLLGSGHSVTQVAIAVGYDTPSAFIAMFRRALGTTPAKYFAVGDTDDASHSHSHDQRP